MQDFSVTVVSYEETRDIDHIPDPDRPGFLAELRPWPGSERYFLKLRLSTGESVRAQFTREDFNTLLKTPEMSEDAGGPA